MIAFIIGIFCGCIAGVMVMCLCSIASDSDKRMEDIISTKEESNE